MAWKPKNNEQRTALKRVSKWMNDPSSKVFYLGGYAGTGKTELARHFAEGVAGNVCFGALTGKAVLVLIQRGCFNARTIHSWLYSSTGRSSEKLRQLESALADMVAQDAPPSALSALEEEIAREAERVDQPSWRMKDETELSDAALVVLDECSMIDDRIGQDLLRTCKKILVLGDPAQLPPVRGTGFFTNRQPDYMLTEVVRHDNGILDLATRVRGGELDIPFGRVNEDVEKLDKRELSMVDYAGASQLITGRNVSRMRLNVGVRIALGRNGIYPVAGDRVICLRNHREHGLVNGQIETAAISAIQIDADCIVLSLLGHIVPDADEPPDPAGDPTPLSVYTGHFEIYENPNRRLASYWDRLEFDEFDFGYAITVHKAQGGQWQHPWLCDDGFNNWSLKDRQRWLYTAVTRAVNKLTIVA